MEEAICRIKLSRDEEEKQVSGKITPVLLVLWEHTDLFYLPFQMDLCSMAPWLRNAGYLSYNVQVSAYWTRKMRCPCIERP